MDYVVTLILAGAVAVYMYTYGRRGSWTTDRSGERRGRRLLAKVLAQYGGELRSDGWYGWLELDDRDITVEIQVDSDHRYRYCQLVISGRFEGGSGPPFYVQPRADFGTSQPFGDLAEFDARCVVATENRAAATHVWSARAQSLAAEMFRKRATDSFAGKTPGSVQSDGHTVVVQRKGPFTRAESFDRAFALVAELTRSR